MKHLLVIAPNWVGDTVLCTPLLVNLRRAFPTASLDVLALERVRPLLAQHPAIDHLITTPNGAGFKKWVYRFYQLRTLRARQYDATFLLPNSFGAALLAFLIGAKRRIGYARDGRSLFLTDPLPWNIQQNQHQVERYLALLQTLDIPIVSRDLSLHVSAEAEAFAKEIWEHYQLTSEQFIIGLNPGGAFGPSKRWLPSRFAALADHLQLVEKARVIFFGNKADQAIVDQITASMRTPALSLVGKDTLDSLGALIRRCAVLVTNDSGPMHIASAFQIPVVAIFGPTDPRQTGPYRVPHITLQARLSCTPCFQKTCPLPKHLCMEEVTVESVVQAIRNLTGAKR